MCFRSAIIPVGRTTFQLYPRCVASHGGGQNVFYPPIQLASKRHVASYIPNTPLRVYAERLASAINDKREYRHVRLHYKNLVDASKTARGSHAGSDEYGPLTHPQMNDIIYALASSTRPTDLSLIEQLLSDLPTVFGLERTIDLHTAVIRALIEHGKTHTAHRWLSSMKLKPGHLKPTLEQWHMFLEYCSENGEAGWISSGMEAMRMSGCTPTNETFEIRLRALFDSNPRMDKVIPVINEIHTEGLPYSATISQVVYDGFAKYALMDHAVEAQRLYLLPFKDLPNEAVPTKPERDPWDDLLSQVALKDGALAAIKQCKTFQRRGLVPSSKTLSAILKHSSNVADLRNAAKELGVPANVVHWTFIINNVILGGDIPAALSIYKESQESGIRPDNAMAHPLIHALCRSGFATHGEAQIDQALQIYNDLVASFEQDNHPATRGPDIAIYAILLRAVSSLSNDDKYYPIAISLLKDMQSRQIPMDNSPTVASVTVLLMRNSRSFEEAFKTYARICRDGINSRLDQRGFEVVLAAFCKLSFGGSIPPLQHYFDIVRDMRNAGYGTTGRVYTTLLKQLAMMATHKSRDPPLPEDMLHRLATAIRRLHDHLTLDASVTPDARVWTQLMDAYQRCGYFVDAYRVWDVMYLSGQYDSVSVTVILDGCGFAGARDVALKIWTKLQDDGYSFDQANWKAWLECLCRLGNLDEAVKMLCMEMGQSGQKDVAPDEACVRVVLSFASAQNQQGEVRSRIRRYLPELWKTLPEDLRLG